MTDGRTEGWTYGRRQLQCPHRCFKKCGNKKSESIFSKFYHRHSVVIVKYNIGLTLLQQGLSEYFIVLYIIVIAI